MVPLPLWGKENTYEAQVKLEGMFFSIPIYDY